MGHRYPAEGATLDGIPCASVVLITNNEKKGLDSNEADKIEEGSKSKIERFISSMIQGIIEGKEKINTVENAIEYT